ncbi:MAG: ABC transporter ATP-binding protein [Acidimicrobiia bacterium]
MTVTGFPAAPALPVCVAGTFRLEGVTAGYGESTVLRDADLYVPRGSTVAVLGSNGAGKSTILRVASGLLPLTRGRVHLGDHELTGAGANAFVRAGVCHVPEGRAIFPSLTVVDNLRVFGRLRGGAEGIERAMEAFPRLGQRYRQLAGTMSGGEQQMLALARVYVQRPEVVLLDEVSMGLAPKLVDEIFDYLHQLVAAGVTLVIVEQFVSKALAVADYVYLLLKGRVAFSGEPGELDSVDVFEEYIGGRN